MGCLPLHLLSKACYTGTSTVKVMTLDGRCLRFYAPLIVKEVLMEYPSHALFLSDSVRSLGERVRPLHSTISLQPGHSYFLIPQPTGGVRRPCSAASMETSTAPAPSLAASRTKSGRRVSFATPPDNADLRPVIEHRNSDYSTGLMASLKKSSVEFLPSPSEGVVRLKMVVTKKQLASALSEGGDCMSMVEGLLSPLLREAEAAAPASNISCNVSWRPSLKSILEST